MGLLYRETYEVPFYESDTNHYMKLPQLLALALQISAKQSLKLGIGDDIVFKRYGLVWVVTDYIIDIERLPKHAEKIVIETEAKAHNKLLCYRYFYIYGEDGQKIITISSAFVLMDFKTRKIHPVLDDITSIYQSQRIKKVIRGPKYHPIGDSKVKQYHVRYF
ncbi:TPA: acyl-[acyl-carrier-protein] thioesterase, partial [Streptococcus agalactiae]|nr:acyl-[acyl-carrier-protein] thioesterase [Streptococcus agalactiae]HEO7604364.1 acyl-[acyl-carrier-protein] thioesterase [Streptococcus agalactiae]